MRMNNGQKLILEVNVTQSQGVPWPVRIVVAIAAFFTICFAMKEKIDQIRTTAVGEAIEYGDTLLAVGIALLMVGVLSCTDWLRRVVGGIGGLVLMMWLLPQFL